MNEKTGEWMFYAGLLVALAAPAAYMTVAFSTMNSRINDLGERMGRLETKVDAMDKKFDRKLDELDQKLDRLLLALAGRGVVLPAKMDGKQSGAKR